MEILVVYSQPFFCDVVQLDQQTVYAHQYLKNIDNESIQYNIAKQSIRYNYESQVL